MSGFDEDPQFEIISMPEDPNEPTGEQTETEEDLDSQDGTDRLGE